MTQITLFHNPRCSKSRAALQLLQDNGVEPDIRLYLDNPPDQNEIKTLLRQLDISPRELLRKGEQAYKDNNLKDASLSDAELIKAMQKYPKLIERPIAIQDDRAVIGRPPERVLELLL